jgi:hypothetical protein
MATIRNQRNVVMLVLKRDAASQGRENVQAVRSPGSFYLPSVSCFAHLQPSRLHGEEREKTARHSDRIQPNAGPAWSGCPGGTWHRALSATLSVN